ncbi:MAG TPA: DMT family transporter [Micropepsaceae bacterium]|nr:DMT family transporter [Micropepsaceae bacterium]
MTPDRPLLGIGCKLLATIFFAVLFAAIRWLGPDFPIGEMVFFRGGLGAVVVVIAALLTGGPSLLKTNNISSHALRSSAGTISMFCNFAAYTLLPLANATALGFASPLFVVIMAALVLSERVHAYRWTAVIIGFLGVIVIAGPEAGLSRTALYGALFAIGGAGLQGAAMILIRRMSAYEHSITIAFYFMLTSTTVSLLTVWFGWQVPTVSQTAVLLLAGISGGVGQIFLSFSYRYSEASVLAPFDYAAMIWAVILGYLIFGELPAPQVWVGGAIVIGSGLLIFWRERMFGRQRPLPSTTYRSEERGARS